MVETDRAHPRRRQDDPDLGMGREQALEHRHVHQQRTLAAQFDERRIRQVYLVGMQHAVEVEKQDQSTSLTMRSTTSRPAGVHGEINSKCPAPFSIMTATGSPTLAARDL